MEFENLSEEVEWEERLGNAAIKRQRERLITELATFERLAREGQ